jgi:hypothetical protein
MLNQQTHAIGRHQPDAMKALQASRAALHHDPGMVRDRLACVLVQRDALGRQFDHVGQISAISLPSFQLKKDERARP